MITIPSDPVVPSQKVPGPVPPNLQVSNTSRSEKVLGSLGNQSWYADQLIEESA